MTNESILNRCWEKDYFTSSLLSMQRGTAPALPISGVSHAVWPSSAFQGGPSVTGNVAFDSGTTYPNKLLTTNGNPLANAQNFFNSNSIVLSFWLLHFLHLLSI